MKEVKWKEYAIPLGVFPYVFWGIYLFENGFDLIAGMLGFVLICVAIAIVVMVKG